MKNKFKILLKFGWFLILFVGSSHLSLAQVQDTTRLPDIIEDQLENLTEANEDNTSEDDTYLQDMNFFLKNKINLNYADEGLLQQLQLLTPVQINNLIAYRNLFGNFISIYEIQAIPTWNISMIRRILPYITVDEKIDLFNSFGKRFKNGNHTLLVRGTQILEKQKGYLLDPDSVKNYYPGSPHKLLVRYKYKFGNLLQYGFTAEKDAGEQFFKGAQKQGFDFYSAHLFVRNLGIIKSLAVGDFSVNMGQGLTQWQSLSFARGALSTKRQSDVLRPYNSAGEIAFHRGAGITLKKNNWEATGFGSFRKVDASFNPADTMDIEDYISSLYNTGYHRTANEIAGKGALSQTAFGGNVNYKAERFHIGANAIHFSFDHPLIKNPVLYNQYALNGKKFNNYSVDYSFNYKNVHFFGEAAIDKNQNEALVNGLVVSANSRVDLSFLHRKISRAYESLYTSAFTQNTLPVNESGFYSSINIAPTDKLNFFAYVDIFKFPWLKYRVDAPSYGKEYMVQMTYSPSRQAEFYSRYSTRNKGINYNPENLTLNPVVGKGKQELRVQFKYALDRTFTFRSRVDLSWFDKRGNNPQNGFLTYFDVIYKPLFKALSGNVRLLYFETDGYDARLYAFENDVLYGYSIPMFNGKGYRYYLNVSYKATKNLQFWCRFAQTIYSDREKVGSGLDESLGNKRSELKLQAQFSF